MNVRWSASSIKKFKNCPFGFYCKITKQVEDKVKDNSYGDAGNAVHHALEYYYTHLIDMELTHALEETKIQFNEMWEALNIINPKIDKDTYWLCIINGIKLGINYTDLEYQFNFSLPVNFLGYADVIDKEKHEIGDWKTSTYKKAKVADYKEQLRYYAYAYYKEFGIIPINCWVYFNKVNKIFKFKFTQDSMNHVEKTLLTTEKEWHDRYGKLDFPRKSSRTNCFFCPYKTVCSTDLLREKKAEKEEVIFHLKNHKLLVEGSIPDIIHRKIEKLCNFEVKNAHFIKKAMLMKGIHYDGIKRLYKRKEYGGETFIGYMHGIHKILKEYAHSKGKILRLVIKDYRDKEVFEHKIKGMPDKLNIPFEKYDYQDETADTLIKYRWGIAEIGTGGGKTVIAAEVIRRLSTLTLFIIDNKDLLLQTKKEYEEMLGVKCGIVGMGKKEWEYPIVLATIQTLEKHCKNFAFALEKINLVVYDEAHIIASKSFEKVSKYLINSKYRCGFSATARRDDGNDKVIYAHTGEVIYKKKAGSLIKENVLIDPTAIFYEYESKKSISDNWQNEYTDSIVENENRNNLILDIVKKHEGKQIMILCKMIKHCEWFLDNIPGAQLIYGRTKDDVRAETIEDFKSGKTQILIGNLKIFNKGINLKNLDVLINAAGNAGDVLTTQTIGRVLRKNPGKDKAYYIDFIDKGDYVYKHSMSRISALKNEDYKVSIEKYS